MKRTIEIVYARSLKLNRGNYQQDAPMWSEKMCIELNGHTEEEVAQIEKEEYQKLKDRIDERALGEWNRTALELSGLRVRVKDGIKFPSVTSILKPEPYTGNPEYGTRGTEIHRICNKFIKDGTWEEPKVKLEKVSFDQIPYKEFFAKHKERLDFTKHKTNIEVFNDKWLYSGEIDLICRVDKKWTLVDLKTGGWDWPQLVAYLKCGSGKIEQLAVFDLKTWALEVLPLADIGEYWENFLWMRGRFKERFGV